MKLALGVLVAVLVLVSLPMLASALLGRTFLYHPTRTSLEPLKTDGWQLARIKAAAPDTRLVGLVRRAGDADVPWLLFFGGNAMGLDANKWVLDRCAGGAPWGLATFAYRGYDGSDGQPTQAALLADSEVIVQYLKETYSVTPERLVIVGQSLGSGIAAHLAAHLQRNGTPPRALALMSPYTSIARVFDEQVPIVPVGWLAPDPYPTDQLLGDLPAPILMIHGTADGLIPIQHSHDLKAALGPRAELLALEGFEHNGLWEDRRSTDAVRRLAVKRRP